MSVKSSTELMLYVVLTMPTLNKAYLYLFIYLGYLQGSENGRVVTIALCHCQRPFYKIFVKFRNSKKMYLKLF